MYCFEAERHSTTSIVCCGRGVSGACVKGCFHTGSLVQTGHGSCKIGDVKAVIRTPERTGELNTRLPVRGALSSVALELWCDSGECESKVIWVLNKNACKGLLWGWFTLDTSES